MHTHEALSIALKKEDISCVCFNLRATMDKFIFSKRARIQSNCNQQTLRWNDDELNLKKKTTDEQNLSSQNGSLIVITDAYIGGYSLI